MALLADQPEPLAGLIREVCLLAASVPDVPGEVEVTIMRNLARRHGGLIRLQRKRHWRDAVRAPLEDDFIAERALPLRQPALPPVGVGVHAPDLPAPERLAHNLIDLRLRHLPVLTRHRRRLPMPDDELVAGSHLGPNEARSVVVE